MIVRNLLQTKITYGKALAISLMAYAKTDEKISSECRRLFSSFLPSSISAYPNIGECIKILVPENSESAMKRARWLFRMVEEKKLPESREVAMVLGAWARGESWEEPRQLVIGVVGVAIPGITLGKIKRRETLIVVAREDVAQTNGIAHKINQVCLSLLSRAFVAAENDIKNIEPEVGGWFFGNRDIDYYTASGKQMLKIKNDLSSLNVNFTSIENAEAPEVLAISPAVNSTCRVYWKLKGAII